MGRASGRKRERREQRSDPLQAADTASEVLTKALPQVLAENPRTGTVHYAWRYPDGSLQWACPSSGTGEPEESDALEATCLHCHRPGGDNRRREIRRSIFGAFAAAGYNLRLPDPDS